MDATLPIGVRIQRRRQALGMDQERLAALVGVSRSAVSNWERGRHFPQRHLGAVEEALGISLAEPPAIPRNLQRAMDNLVDEIGHTPGLTPGEREAVIAALEEQLRGGPAGGHRGNPSAERRRRAS